MLRKWVAGLALALVALVHGLAPPEADACWRGWGRSWYGGYSRSYGYYGRSYCSYPGYGYYGSTGYWPGAYSSYGMGGQPFMGGGGAGLMTVLAMSGGSSNTSMYMNVPMGNGWGPTGYLQVPIGGAAGRPTYLQMPMGGTPGQPVYLQMQLGSGGVPSAPMSMPQVPQSVVPTTPGSYLVPGSPTTGQNATPSATLEALLFEDPGLPFVALPPRSNQDGLADREPATKPAVRLVSHASTHSPFRLAVLRKDATEGDEQDEPALVPVSTRPANRSPVGKAREQAPAVPIEGLTTDLDVPWEVR